MDGAGDEARQMRFKSGERRPVERRRFDPVRLQFLHLGKNRLPAALGATAMRALRQICTTLDLEYAGMDFAVAADGSILLFEANATMVVFPPSPDAMWDYRRRAIDSVLAAASSMLLKHAGGGESSRAAT